MLVVPPIYTWSAPIPIDTFCARYKEQLNASNFDMTPVAKIVFGLPARLWIVVIATNEPERSASLEHFWLNETVAHVSDLNHLLVSVRVIVQDAPPVYILAVNVANKSDRLNVCHLTLLIYTLTARAARIYMIPTEAAHVGLILIPDLQASAPDS
jgi:hypothetical protein